MIYSSSWWQLETAGWAVDEDGVAVALAPADALGDAALVLSAYRKDVFIGDTELRKLTERGAPAAVRRVPIRCGDFRGFHATYEAEEVHWRVWWLASRKTHVYATFNCSMGDAGRHDAVLDWMLATLREVRNDA
jgi:hypothetical protein